MKCRLLKALLMLAGCAVLAGGCASMDNPNAGTNNQTPAPGAPGSLGRNNPFGTGSSSGMTSPR